MLPFSLERELEDKILEGGKELLSILSVPEYCFCFTDSQDSFLKLIA